MIFVGSAAVTFVMLYLIAMAIMDRRAKLPRRKDDSTAAGRRQHPLGPAALTPSVVLSLGLWPRCARHRRADRRQSAPAIPGSIAGEIAGLLLCRYPEQRCRRGSIEFIRKEAPAATGGSRADAARTHRRGQRHQGEEELKPTAQARLGVAERSRHHLRDRYSGGLAHRRRRMVAGGLFRAAAALDGETDRRRARPEGRRHPHRQRARPQHHRERSPTCAWSTGKASASISCWFYSPNTFAARRIRISQR